MTQSDPEIPIVTDHLKRRQDPILEPLHDAMVARLSRAEATAGALKPGDTLPPFMLANAEGQLVSSDELLAAGPLVLSFVRGGWCSYCRAELAALRDAAADIRGAGATLVVISPEIADRPLAMKGALQLPFEVLCDHDSGLALAFGLVYRVPDDVRQAYLNRGNDLSVKQGNDAWLLPVPATYVADRAGTIRFAHVDPDFRNRPDPIVVVEALRQIR